MSKHKSSPTNHYCPKCGSVATKFSRKHTDPLSASETFRCTNQKCKHQYEPTALNPVCIYCGSVTSRFGVTPSGRTQRYRCKCCKRTFSEDKVPNWVVRTKEPFTDKWLQYDPESKINAIRRKQSLTKLGYPVVEVIRKDDLTAIAS